MTEPWFASPEAQAALGLLRSQFAWIEREASGDNDCERIMHAARVAMDLLDAKLLRAANSRDMPGASS